jgi:hypothetical protein
VFQYPESTPKHASCLTSCWGLCVFYTFVDFKTSENKTCIDPDKIFLGKYCQVYKQAVGKFILKFFVNPAGVGVL